MITNFGHAAKTCGLHPQAVPVFTAHRYLANCRHVEYQHVAANLLKRPRPPVPFSPFSPTSVPLKVNPSVSANPSFVQYNYVALKSTLKSPPMTSELFQLILRKVPAAVGQYSNAAPLQAETCRKERQTNFNQFPAKSQPRKRLRHGHGTVQQDVLESGRTTPT